MGYPKVNLLIIDKNMNTVEVEVNSVIFSQLNIEANKVKKNKSKSELNKAVNDFLLQFKEDPKPKKV